jgi:hypothetical protein
MKYEVEMGSGAMIYIDILSFTKIGSGIQKFTGGVHNRQRGDLINQLFFFLQNEETRLKAVTSRPI